MSTCARTPDTHKQGHALIVDRDCAQADRLAVTLAEMGYVAVSCPDRRQARLQAALQAPDLLLLGDGAQDDGSPSLFDDGVLPAHCVLIMLGDADCQTASPARARRAGASLRLPRPVDADTLRRAVLRLQADAREMITTGTASRLAGNSAPLAEVVRQISLAANTSLPVFVSGETGTGKELVARCLHEQSQRARGPFIAINGGAIAPQLFESEAFGHERGSFTGALQQHAGFFEQAQGGTLFLDEITEMPPSQQVKLLRVIESGTLRRVGGSATLDCDVRIVAATNRDPVQAVAQGWLREDLYYRLAVLEIRTPPLRERPEDIEPLARHFLRQCGPRQGRWPKLTPQALAVLQQRSWPGNARELRNAIQRAWLMALDRDIDGPLVAGAG